MPMRPRCRLGIAPLVIALAACSANDTTSPAPEASLSTGNNAPSGTHYNLNIIGVANGKNANMNGASGNVIFVGLGTKNNTATSNILLSQSTDGSFQVLDKNGTDGTASFELPAPGTYTVWARALGTPGGQAKMTTCASDVAGNGTVTDTVCSTQNEVFVRGTGKSSFKDVTSSLTTIVIDAISESAAFAACGGNNQTSIRVNLFDPCLEGYFWNYDNNGLRLLQIRFYPKS